VVFDRIWTVIFGKRGDGRGVRGGGVWGTPPVEVDGGASATPCTEGFKVIFREIWVVILGGNGYSQDFRKWNYGCYLTTFG
jgi:hypothetical protein